MGDDGWDSGPDSTPVYSQTYQSRNYSNRQDSNNGGGSGYRGGFGSYRQDSNDEGGSGFKVGFGNSYGGDRRGGGRGRGRGRGWGNREGRDDRNGEGDSRGSWRNQDDSSEPVVMTVYASLVGRIIGKAGSKIRELQDQSGARIKVSNDDETGEGKVVITGSADNQAKAKALIDEIVNEAVGTSGQLDFLLTCKTEDSDKPIDWDALNQNYEIAQKEKWAKCPPLIKNFYREDEAVKQMSEKEVERFRKMSNNIMVSRVFGETDIPIPKPVKTFEQAFQDYPEILEEICKQGFATPSPIQCQAWPVLLQGMDLIGISQTGSGKTIAFLLPALIHIEGQPVPRSERGGANILILAPTRELALQIDKEVKKYSYKGIKCICVYGGGSRKEQANVLDTGVEIIIATPGRLNDFV